MRAIRFRGQDAKTGEWRYGYYATLHIARQDNHDVLLGYDEIPSIFNDEPGERSNGGFWHTVKPETVGQFSTLRDKNGKEIYEGDIVKSQFSDTPFGIVTWHDDGYFFIDTSFGEWKWRNFGNGFLPIGELMERQIDGQRVQLEVIGNVHDNPGMIKRK